ncbi:AraC family transcriptional regulator [Phaeobacter sp.]|uniref:AraC family transcriptional regulator n=1 Tax=Phaeobacter sp. TaxID=1902409 RepID=UPI0025F5A301|nr:AraC family transcriptional regulator [Phaeobacter sp.]
MSGPNHRYSDATITKACAFIEADLSAQLAIRDIAARAGLAEHHFQRRFALATGETVSGYIRARRMEKAAQHLTTTSCRIIDVALDCGFETHAAFSKAFKSHFQCTPSELRRSGLPPSQRGAAPRPFLVPQSHSAQHILPDLVTVASQVMCYRTQTGMSDGHFFPDLAAISAGFAALKEELTHQRIPAEKHQFATAFKQGPQSFDDPDARAHFGAIFDQPVPLNWSPDWIELAAGDYAIFPHYGSLANLHLTWNKAARVILPRAGLILRHGWMFETYLTNTVDAPSDRLTAQIHLPVEQSTNGTAST